jgi:hypothetical protein
MLEKFNQLAEQAATNVSRRQFLGRFGRGAMVVAAAAGEILVRPDAAHAGRRACDNATSDAACFNAKVGDFCLDGQGAAGRCKAPRGGTACVCAAK